MIETILINFLFLLLPVLIAVIFLENRTTYSNKYIYYIILTSISMLLCMMFPIELEMGFIMDFRYIPFIITALYGGYKMVFPLFLVLNGYRFYIGGEGTYHSLLFALVIFILVPLLSKKFNDLDARNRILYSAGVVTGSMLFYLVTLSYFFEQLTSEYWLLAIYMMATHIIFMTIVMMLIEKIIFNINRREAFLHSERLNIVSELSASVAHEIRNPLTVTNGFLQLLHGSKSLAEEEKTYIEFSLKELERAEKIVSDFLAFSKPQSAHMVYSNFEKEIAYVASIIKPYAKRHQVELNVHFANTLKKKFDENQVQQCLINLFKNGVEAMDGNGGVLYIDVSEKHKNILIRIKDNGVGMTSEEISQLGKPYYSTKKEGTGLGMIMVYSVINNIKGRIEVESKKGKGTTFLIIIPA
ncbi:HAMP domain-containing sensor histidine kinase [Filibacter tadaridae]|uniref:histidine kinase n=1 Tax=Filibacter tadaridae TaxID=2483811 RepID=A0A3P5XU76_9BACL|nr:Sporulation kinase E [Filibacter tadaridae]